jgi:hypothetical protein
VLQRAGRCWVHYYYSEASKRQGWMDPLNLCRASMLGETTSSEQRRPQRAARFSSSAGCKSESKDMDGSMGGLELEWHYTALHLTVGLRHGQLGHHLPPGLPYARFSADFVGRHFLICTEISSARRDRTGRTTADPVSPLFVARQPSIDQRCCGQRGKLGKLRKYTGTPLFFSGTETNGEVSNSQGLTCYT